jgi:hypothetical protein
MPTARELLDQADAMMRRNRKRGKGSHGDVPTLTDSLAPTVILSNTQVAADPIMLERPGGAGPAPAAERDDADPMPLDTLGDVPVLTDVVVDWPPDEATRAVQTAGTSASPDLDADRPSTPEAVVAAAHDTAASDAGDAFPASAAEAEVAAAELPAPAVLEREADGEMEIPAGADTSRQQNANPSGEPRVPFLDDDFILEIPPPADLAQAAAAQPAPIPANTGGSMLTPGSRDWDALAEEIRMQVLQRLDIFTDSGLREQLGARLSPIVERASAQLIETINRELGELVRGYVAEAIEREIDSWRKRNPE